jgi:hypothetical protein
VITILLNSGGVMCSELDERNKNFILYNEWVLDDELTHSLSFFESITEKWKLILNLIGV